MDGGREQQRARNTERERKEREGSANGASILSLSLDNYLCRPQTYSDALNQGAGAWLFVCERGVCACAQMKRGSCYRQHALEAIRLRSCCCGACPSLCKTYSSPKTSSTHNNCPPLIKASVPTFIFEMRTHTQTNTHVFLSKNSVQPLS